MKSGSLSVIYSLFHKTVPTTYMYVRIIGLRTNKNTEFHTYDVSDEISVSRLLSLLMLILMPMLTSSFQSSPVKTTPNRNRTTRTRQATTSLHTGMEMKSLKQKLLILIHVIIISKWIMQQLKNTTYQMKYV